MYFNLVNLIILYINDMFKILYTPKLWISQLIDIIIYMYYYNFRVNINIKKLI